MALDDVTAPLRDAIAAAERQIAAAEFIDSDADLAEGYDYLAGSIAAVLQQSRTHDKVHPVLHTSTGPYTKMGLDNPDTLYYHADVVPEGTYRIRGIRGSTVDLSFQVLRGDYTPSEVPGGDDAFDDRRLTIADDGSYELIFGPPIDDAPSNYFVLGDGASMLAIREVYGDWIAEHKGSVTVERLDTRDEPARPLDSARAARQYATAAKLLTSRIHTWFNFPKWFYLDEAVNTLTVPRPTPGGLSTQFSSVGHYDLAPDQAMLITVPVSDSPYQGFQLGSLWYISLDYVHHQTSLNTVQAQHDPDGMIRMVIAHRDPGVTNWVETTGRRRGILQFRWQRSDAPIDGSLGPTCEVVDLAQVPGLLPYYDHNRIDADGWAERITARRRGFAERMLG
ncbi:hypothetical protein MUG78_08790 [Gordonia alkaliphila]|uniref:hypothetical protein n=1 Tax=Gordonia alkaliphila TaxID=1053547 RepID=UPI001FF68237|nr:hypothetical protein [Gordonia alkaliphila]MCK0439558.1 hypothetical protein [Gordonia alkaliphila]